MQIQPCFKKVLLLLFTGVSPQISVLTSVYWKTAHIFSYTGLQVNSIYTSNHRTCPQNLSTWHHAVSFVRQLCLLRPSLIWEKELKIFVSHLVLQSVPVSRSTLSMHLQAVAAADSSCSCEEKLIHSLSFFKILFSFLNYAC